MLAKVSIQFQRAIETVMKSIAAKGSFIEVPEQENRGEGWNGKT